MGKYLVILHGSNPPTIEGQEQLRKRLIEELGCTPDAVNAIFDSLPAILQNSLDETQAEDYVRVLQAFGGDVEMLEATSTGQFPVQGAPPVEATLSQGGGGSQLSGSDHGSNGMGGLPLGALSDDFSALGFSAASAGASMEAAAAEGTAQSPSDQMGLGDMAFEDLVFDELNLGETSPQPAVTSSAAIDEATAFELGSAQESVADLLDILDHELEDTAREIPMETEDVEAALLHDLEFGDAAAAAAAESAQDPAPADTPEAPAAPMLDESQFTDLEAELMEALAFGDVDETEESAPAEPEAPAEEQPMEDLGFTLFDGEDAQEAAPAETVEAAKPEDDAAAKAAAEAESNMVAGISFDDDEFAALNDVGGSTPAVDPANVAASGKAFLEEEAGMDLAEVKETVPHDVDPLEARMQPVTAVATPEAPAAAPDDDFKWPEDGRTEEEKIKAAFGQKAGGTAAPAPELVAEEGKKKFKLTRQHKIGGLFGTSLLLLVAFLAYTHFSKPTGFEVNMESLDAMLDAQQRIARKRAENAPIAESERTWIGSAESAELTARIEVTTLGKQLVRWHISVTSPEPPPLTEEEFGTGVERPWMKRAEADGAFPPESAPSGNTVGFEGPGRAYVQHPGGTSRLSVDVQAQVNRQSDEKIVTLWRIQTKNAEEVSIKDTGGKLQIQRLPDKSFVVRMTGEVAMVPGVSTVKPAESTADPKQVKKKDKSK